MELSQKQKSFAQFFSEFSQSSLKLNVFKKKMTLIADVFSKLQSPKIVVK